MEAASVLQWLARFVSDHQGQIWSGVSVVVSALVTWKVKEWRARKEDRRKKLLEVKEEVLLALLHFGAGLRKVVSGEYSIAGELNGRAMRFWAEFQKRLAVLEQEVGQQFLDAKLKARALLPESINGLFEEFEFMKASIVAEGHKQLKMLHTPSAHPGHRPGFMTENFWSRIQRLEWQSRQTIDLKRV